MVGYVTEASVVKTKKGRNPGQQMAIVMLEDGLAESKLLVWPAYFTLYSEMLKEGNVLAIRVEKMKGEKNTYQLCDIKAFRGKSQMIELHELIGE